ncbi:hypothetical protein L1987_45466 [Smallanthus sonchifolius]|uniref:Uncharacterized protein n=2 Tax=Smallanthus sonchifolius TaxID=185202 RepID=A0ACB9FWF9_9ASTR|nr:hypothetical protein L1987_45453 [Smallanthus sonchifolius]KAI3775716.1 hypothetical protein L1987_45466 [Smallanthus sonchifolius]
MDSVYLTTESDLVLLSPVAIDEPRNSVPVNEERATVPSHSQISDMMYSDAMDVEDNCNTQQMPKYHHVTTRVSSGNPRLESIATTLHDSTAS